VFSEYRQGRPAQITFQRPFDGLARLHHHVLAGKGSPADRMCPEAKPSTAGNVSVGKAESIGADSGYRSQPLRLVSIHQIDDHITPMMALHLEQSVGTLVRSVGCIVVPVKEKSAGWCADQERPPEKRVAEYAPAATVSIQ
jgi:hypothetical protein